LNDRTGD
jgi:hypothetical protein